MKSISKDKVIETLYEELKRKDDIIQKLMDENKLLLKTCFKNAENNFDLLPKKSISDQNKNISQ